MGDRAVKNLKKTNNISNEIVSDKEQIPKRIFYVWGANEPKKRDVNLCLLSWYKTMPEYEIIEINENSTKYFNFQKELQTNKYFKMVYDRKMYAFIADYIRVKVLYEHGGIYLDTDVCALKPFDIFLNEPAFVGIEGNKATIGNDWVEPAILGVQKGNLFIKQIVEFYDNEIMKTPLFILPEIFAKYLNENYGINSYPDKTEQQIIKLENITLYPEKYFIPYRLNEKFNFECIEEDTHTMHLWNGSWADKNIIWFQLHKHLMPLFILDIAVKLRKILQNIFSIENKTINFKKTKILTIFGKEIKIG